MKKVKTKVVDKLPGERAERGIYQRFWTELCKTPAKQFLEIKTDAKTQKLIAAFLYYKGRKNKRTVSVAFKNKAMYAYFN